MKLVHFWRFLLLVILFSSCHKSDNPCEEPSLCTKEFRSVFIELKFEGISFQSFGHLETILDDTGEKILTARIDNFPFNPPREEGDPVILSILTDGHMDKISFEKSHITVKFYDVSGGQISEEKYTVRHDCCHVEKISGKDVVVL
jgi:hypothetical protein